MRIAIVTFGCRLNQYETELLKEMAEEHHQIIPLEQKPELIIVNACSVTMNAAQQVRNAIRRAHRASPDGTIIVTGCFPGDMHSKMYEVDRFVANEEKYVFFSRLFASKKRLISKFNSHTRAHVKIQTGCNHFCTYCIVPYLRNAEQSRSPDEIRREITSLVQHGYAEVTLTGIHIGRYCYGTMDLVDLLKDLETANGLKRIRLSSLNPEELSDRFITLLASSSKICHHIHISLQSADDYTLHAMGRTYKISEIEERLNRIAHMIPDCGIGADIITGFPGETAQRFDHTFQFIKKLPFTYLHVFRYSPRKGTLAALFPEKVPEKEKKRRSALLRELALKKSITFRNSFLQKPLNVLIESKRDTQTDCMVGFSANYIRVLIPPEPEAVGAFRDVLIERIDEYETYGTLLRDHRG